MTKDYILKRIDYLEQQLKNYETKLALDEQTEVYYELCLECINEIKLLKSL
jgi:hypothetical protein